jgi:hypothetical protein
MENFKQLIKSFQEDNIMIHLLEMLIGKKVDFTLQTLFDAEEAINKNYPEGHMPLPTTLLPFGFLLGETIVRSFNGEWVTDGVGEIWDIKVKIKDKDDKEILLKPFLRVHKFWEDRTDGLAAMYLIIEYSIDADLSKDNMERFEDEEGWVHFPNGFKFRLHRPGSDKFKGFKPDEF